MDRHSKIINFIFGLFLNFLIASSCADDGVTGNCDVDMWYEAMNRTEGVFLKSMTPGQKMIKEQIEKLVTPVGKTSRGMKMPCSMLYKFTTILNPDMDTTKKEVLFMFIKSDDTKVKGGDDGENNIKGPADMKGNDDKKGKEESSDTTSGEKKEEEESSNEKDGEEKEKEDSSDKNNDGNIETKELFDKKNDEKHEKDDSLDKKDEEKNEKDDSLDKTDDENNKKEDSSDKKDDGSKEKEDSSDKKDDEKNEKEDSSDTKDDGKNEKEDSSYKKDDEKNEKEDSSDKKDDEKNEKEDSLDRTDDEKNKKEYSSDKKDYEKNEKEDSSDKKDDGKNEKEDSLDEKDESEEKDENEDKKDDVNKENESPDQKGDDNEEKAESSEKKDDKNKDKEDSSDKKVDKKKEKEESSDNKEDKNREGDSETVESPEKDPDEKKAGKKSEDGPSVIVDADATDMTDFDDTETEESISNTPKTDPVKEDNVAEGKKGESEKKTGKKLSDAVEEMLSDANFCYSLIYYLHMFYLKESELKEITPGNSLMEKVTRECLMCGVNPAFDWLCAQLTFIHKLYTADINDDLKKTEQVMKEKDKEEKRGFMERIADTIDDLLDFTKSTPDKEEKTTTDENERLGPIEDMKDAKKLLAEGETEEIRTRTRAADAATETDAQALLREENLRIIEQKKIRELSEALEHTEVRMSEKTQVHERKIAQLEIEILKVQNKLLTATLNKSNDTATFSKLENYIIKLENEILRMNISFFNLKKENENLKKKSQQFLMLEDKQAKQKEQERSKSLEVLQKQQDRIIQLSSMLNGQNSMMSELRNRSSQLEEENKTLRDMMAKQNLVMSEVLSKLEKVESQALVTSQQISDLKSSSMSKTQTSGSVPVGLSSEITKSKKGTENKYRSESNQMTGQNCHNLTSQKGCVYVSMLKGQCCSHQKPEVPYGDSNPKRRETAGKHGHIETRDTEKGDTGESGSEAKKNDEHSNNEIEADMLKAIEVELQKEGAQRAKEVEAVRNKEAAVLKAKEAEAVKAKEAEAEAQKAKEKEAAVQKAKEVEAAKVREAIAAAKKAKEAEEQEAKEAWVKKAKEAEDKKAKDAEAKKAKEAAAKKAEDENCKHAKEAEAKRTKEAAVKKIKETEAETEKEKEKEAKVQKEKETEAQMAKELEAAQRAKEADVQKAKEAEAQKVKVAETQRAKDAELQRAKEAQAQKLKEAEVQKENEAEVRKAKETEAQRKAGENAEPPKTTSTINSPAIVNGERILLYQKEVTSGMKDCFAHFVNGKKRDSGFQIHPLGLKGQSEKVWCDMTSGGWTVIQKRQSGTLDFNKSWQQYKDGFGDVFGEHWIGNDLIHLLTNQDKYSLRIDLMDWQRNKVYILYDDFWIDSEAEGYRLHVGGYSGTVGDALAKHDGKKFSTKDVDNDEVGSHVKQFKDWDGSCAKRFSGAWWFYKCYQSNLNGKYYRGGEVPGKKFDGVAWKPWKGPKYSLKRVEMKIRPKDASEVILR